MPLRVLVIDTSTLVRNTTKRTLRRRIAHIEISEMADGQSTISLVNDNKIDFIFSNKNKTRATNNAYSSLDTLINTKNTQTKVQKSQKIAAAKHTKSKKRSILKTKYNGVLLLTQACMLSTISHNKRRVVL